MKQYKGIPLEKRQGVRKISTQPFQRAWNPNNTGTRPELQYRIAGVEHPDNYYYCAADIKECIDQALNGSKYYSWIIENRK